MPSKGTLVFNDQKLQAPEMYATESLGVGVSVPTSNREVVGNAYVSSNLDVGGSLGLTKGSSLFAGDSVVMETSKHVRPIVKYPEIAMTANSSGGYVVSASGTPNVNHSPYHAFNNSAGNTSDSWHSENSYTTSGSRESTTSTLSTWTGGGGGHNGAWLKIQLPNKIVLNHIRLKQRTAVSGLQHPRLFSIVGSNDDSNWYLVHEETSRTFTGATAPNIDHYTMSGPYASTASGPQWLTSTTCGFSASSGCHAVPFGTCACCSGRTLRVKVVEAGRAPDMPPRRSASRPSCLWPYAFLRERQSRIWTGMELSARAASWAAASGRSWARSTRAPNWSFGSSAR